MKTTILFTVALLQVGVLAWMAGEREWIGHYGKTVYLRTAPVDPRDVMRGDYVRLNYELSNVPRKLCRGKLAEADFSQLPADSVVYAALSPDENGVAALESVSLDRPTASWFIRGRTERSGPMLQVRYGIEAFFTEQGKGAALEQGRTIGDFRVPLEMKVALSRGGLGVLQNYRWCPLGLGLALEMRDVVRPPGGSGPRQQHAVAATLTLLNAGSNDLGIVDVPGGGSLRLLPDARWGGDKWEWAPPESTPASMAQARVVVLKPGQTHSMKVDFEDPRWFVTTTGQGAAAKPFSKIETQQAWSARFRFEYHPPDRAACANLPNANLIWHGTLLSRGFSPVGNID